MTWVLQKSAGAARGVHGAAKSQGNVRNFTVPGEWSP